MLPEIIDEGRFRLRPFRLTDVDTVFAYASDDEFLRYLPIAMPYSRADANSFLAGQILLDRELNPSWAIEVDGRRRRPEHTLLRGASHL